MESTNKSILSDTNAVIINQAAVDNSWIGESLLSKTVQYFLTEDSTLKMPVIGVVRVMIFITGK